MRGCVSSPGLRTRSAHYLMREAITEYVAREEKREAFRQEGVAAWAHYEATGLHLTEREADAWMARLEADRTSSRRNVTTDLVA